jgi:hypothetical protein
MSLVAASALVALGGPAHAAGDTYVWVADDGPLLETFSDPANWARQSDGQPGVPGPGDTALVVDPDGEVTIHDAVTVGSLVIEGVAEDGDYDLTVTQTPAASLTATSVTLRGDSYIGGDLVADALTVSGALDVDGDIALLHGGVADAEHPGQLVLDGVTSPDLIGIDNGPVLVDVIGARPSEVLSLVVRDATIDLSDDAGATYAGRVFSTGDLTIVGDVPAETVLSNGFFGNDPGEVVWDEPEATLDGLFAIEQGRPVSLPDHLTVNGILGNEGPASGGSVVLGPGGRLRFTDAGEGSGWQPNLALSGTFTSDESAVISIEATGTPCVGDEDLLIRAAGGVTAGSNEIGLDNNDLTWLDIEAVALENELVGVYRRTSSEVDDTCLAGGPERVARAMFRDLLGRRADAGGAGYWGRKLDGGMAAATVASRLLATDEARVHLIESTWAEWACDGEPPSDLAVAMGVEYLRGGGSLTALRADVVASTIPSDGDPVVCLYQATLGRMPDPGGRAYVEGRLESESVQKVSRRLVMSAEGRRVRCHRLYQHLLARDAQPDEVADAVAAIQYGRTEPWVTAQIAGTTEYVERNAR